MKSIQPGLLDVNFKWRANGVVPKVALPILSQQLELGNLLVFRNLFDQHETYELKRAVLEWADRIDKYPSDKSASVPGLNYHRYDDVNKGPYFKRRMHHYGFGDIDSLDMELGERMNRFILPLLDLENRLAGTMFKQEDPAFRVKLYNHCPGGGFFETHTHPYLPQKVAYFLSLSSLGTDYMSGFIQFHTPFGHIKINENFPCGSVLFFKYDLLHGVAPVDPKATVAPDGERGLWVLSGELIESYSKTKALNPI